MTSIADQPRPVEIDAPPELVAEYARRRAQLEQRRLALTSSWTSPSRLALALNPATIVTPALQKIETELARVEAGEIERLAISLPPQEGKSDLVSHHWVLHMLRRNPNLRAGIVSYSDDNASRISDLIRNDITTFDGTTGPIDLGLRLRKDNKARSRWNLDFPARGGVYAVGIGGSLTGRPLDILVIDDPVKDIKAAESLLQSEDAWNWWMSVARPRLAPAAPVIVIQTRWHEKDLLGRLLNFQAEQEQAGVQHVDRWTVVNIPAQADHHPELGETDPIGREPGEYLTSARGRTYAQWETTKNTTAPRIWSALYQGQPTPDAGDVWQRHWWRFYDEPLWTAHGDGTFTVRDSWRLSQSWDFTFKDKTSSDWVVGWVMARKGPTVRLVDRFRARASFTASITAMRELSSKWPQSLEKLVEAKANGDAVIDTLKDELPGIVAVDPGSDSKYARAVGVSPLIRAGNVQLPIQAIRLWNVDEFIEEASAFPNGTHDDQVDGLAQYLREKFRNAPGTISSPLAAARTSTPLGIPSAGMHSRGQTTPTLPADARTY